MDDYMNYTKKEKEAISKLEKIFNKVFVYNGDEELISSCNSEYSINPDDYIFTDGLVNVSMGKSMYRLSENIVNMGVHLITSIRGASYVIIVSQKPDGKLDLDLRIDRPFLEEKVMELLKICVTKIKKYNEDMQYYIDICRGKALPPDVTIDEILH